MKETRRKCTQNGSGKTTSNASSVFPRTKQIAHRFNQNEQMIELDYPHHSWLLISALQFRTIAATWSKVGDDAKELIFISCFTFTFSSLVIPYNNGPATATMLTNKMHIDSATLLHYVLERISELKILFHFFSQTLQNLDQFFFFKRERISF